MMVCAGVVVIVVGGGGATVDTGGGADDAGGGATVNVVAVVETASRAVVSFLLQPTIRVRITRVASMITNSFFIFLLLLSLINP